MNYKLVMFVLSVIGVICFTPLTYWLVSLGGMEMSLIGFFWWITLTALSVLATVICAVFTIDFLINDYK